MSKTKFTYVLLSYKGYRIISIVDLNMGMSVTNNMENVIQQIVSEMNIPNIKDFIVVYRDSTENWDGWDTLKEDFVIINANSEQEAIESFILMKEKGILHPNEGEGYFEGEES